MKDKTVTIKINEMTTKEKDKKEKTSFEFFFFDDKSRKEIETT